MLRTMPSWTDFETEARPLAQLDAVADELALLVVRDLRGRIFEMVARDASVLQQAVEIRA